MSNPAGYHSHGSRGGKFARKSNLNIDFAGLGELTEQLENLGGNIEKTIGEALEKAGKQVQEDTLAALDKKNLPAKGAFSHGETAASVARDIRAEYKGMYVEIQIGFDKSKPGAGGFLITGTPKMQPDKALADIYSRKTTSRAYEKRIKKQIEKDLQDEIDRRLG